MTRNRIVNPLLAVVVSLLTLGVVEGLARAWEHFHPPRPVADYLWDWQQRWDGDFYVFASDAVGWPPWEEFNADGVRDRTHAVEKPEGVQRLVFLGDSVTLGDGIKPEQAYPQQLQARFDEEGRPVEVFNVALLGWSTRQERLAYQRIVRRYQPDHVVLAVCLNDIPELQNNLTRPGPTLAALHRRLALVRAIVRAPSREIASVEELFERRESPVVGEAMERFFAEVRALRDEVRADGAGFAMAVFPFRFQVRSGAPRPVVQDDIRAFAGKEKIPFADLLPALSELGDRAFVDYDHLSPAGARRVTQALLDSALLALPPAVPRPGSASEAELVAALRGDGRERVRGDAARALGQTRRASAAEALFDALDDPRASVRWRAAEALHAIQPPAEIALPRLVGAMKSRDPYVRGFATWSLGNFGPLAERAVPALVEGLATDDAFGRAGAAAALAKIGPAAGQAVDALVAALGSADVDRRWKAARTLGRIGPAATSALPALQRAAREDHEYVRAQAVRALGRIAPSRPEVVSALKAATKDRDAEVRRQAELAITGKSRTEPQ
jgi:HEAT repeat protein/lysophospholipase L1-like esterase